MKVEEVLHQIDIMKDSLLQIMEQITEEEWVYRPHPDKFSVGELVEHIAVLPAADLRIAEETNLQGMNDFYQQHEVHGLNRSMEKLTVTIDKVRTDYLSFTETQLSERKTAYWGVTYSRFEWLLEILVHLTHHRGQLYAMLVFGLGKELKVRLFE
ncbi:DinB family protein [Jeotgalibacillus aurantiacus]|uniref:DinB family protein n=1 Tax=Jeotgalibacillus aurantiacus TaxID=2763266 RepID=UPI001D0A0580|nr:DinB family protein [Jeotgalibacillus aurantiacus]